MENKIKEISEIELNENQKKAYELLESVYDYSIRRGTICLVGNFQSGKTTLIKHFLMKKFGDINKYYISLNKYLLERLLNEGTELSVLSKIKAKTRLIMEVALNELLEKHFAQNDLLVLDAIEIIFPYNLNLISLVNRHTNDGKICIICVPENDKFAFNFSWGSCSVIKLE
ncbi:MAG: hypothetical protein ACUVWN_15795 [bacterium]